MPGKFRSTLLPLLGAAVLTFAALLPSRSAVAASRAEPDPPRLLVVIDAGHGGVDPGAKGPDGTREKDVTLAVALRLAEILRDETDYEVKLTRTRDTLIALRDRPRLANRWRGEAGKEAAREALFISIHCNASSQKSVRGFETFFLSDAKTADARRVAEMENAAEQYEEKDDRPKDALSFILNDLRQNKYLRDSSAWAALVQRRLGNAHPGPDRGVKQAGFVVLDGAFMPAVLVEIGFVTHPAEERLLRGGEHQRAVARQLARSIREFFDGSSSASLAGGG